MESNIDKVEHGKQIGITFSHKNENNDIVWSSVAIQKWDGFYKVYIDEIFESKMEMEDYLVEIIKNFRTIGEAIEFINTNSKTSFELLKPCKGQKIFNPLINC